MTAQWVCPRCGRHVTDVAARSRIDNVTHICPACGTAEALEEYQGSQPTFATWMFPPMSVWQFNTVGDGVGAGRYVQFLRFTRQCRVYVHSLSLGRDVTIGSVQVFRKLYARVPPDQERTVLSEFIPAPTVYNIE